MPEASFFVPGKPAPQPRPRVAMIAGNSRVYTPNTAKAWKRTIALVSKQHRPASPIEGPVSVCLSFYIAPSATHAKVLAKTAESRHTFQRDGDVDNLAKAVLDAMTDCGWWKDDAQVWALTIHKQWCGGVRRDEGCQIDVVWD